MILELGDGQEDCHKFQIRLVYTVSFRGVY